MRVRAAYMTSLSTTAIMVASALFTLALVAGILGLQRWPGAFGDPPVGTIGVGDGSDSAAPAVFQLPGLPPVATKVAAPHPAPAIAPAAVTVAIPPVEARFVRSIVIETPAQPRRPVAQQPIASPAHPTQVTEPAPRTPPTSAPQPITNSVPLASQVIATASDAVAVPSPTPPTPPSVDSAPKPPTLQQATGVTAPD